MATRESKLSKGKAVLGTRPPGCQSHQTARAIVKQPLPPRSRERRKAALLSLSRSQTAIYEGSLTAMEARPLDRQWTNQGYQRSSC